ncbi:MAG: hypothetical protein EOM48_10345 [Bacilli bacterium]|nr:hypothetical protein [Bacilli bacterium]
MKVVSTSLNPVIPFYVGTGGIAKGQLAMLSSNTAIDATEGATTAIYIGIAQDDYAAGVVGYFDDIRGTLVELPIYQGGATDACVASDIGKAYDIIVDSGIMKLDLNDTTGACVVVQSYNNDTQTAIVRFISAVCYLA